MKRAQHLLCTLLLAATSVVAQQTIEVSGRAIGGSSGEQLQSVLPATDGGFLLAGTTDSDDADLTTQRLGGGDFWMLKTTPEGAIAWQRRYGGTGSEVARGIAAAINGGGYFVVGTANALGGDVATALGQEDIWLLRVSESGQIIWQKTLGGSGYDHAVGVLALPDGGCIVYGQSNSTDGDVTAPHGSTDIWLVNLKESGTIRWERSIGGLADESVAALKADPQGGYWVLGSTISNDPSMPTHRGLTDALVARLDDDGHTQWLRTYGGSGDDHFTDLLLDASGQYFVCGHTTSTDGDIALHHGETDAWVVRLQSDGQIIWSQTYGGLFDDHGVRIFPFEDQTLLLVANSFDLEEGVADRPGQRFDALVMVIKPEGGEVQRTHLFGGSGVDLVQSAALQGGMLALTGLTNSNDGDVTGAKGQMDGLFMRIDATTLLAQRPQSELVRAYPNPANSVVLFDRMISGELWTDTGVLIRHFEATNQLELHTLGAGVYFVKVGTTGQMIRITKMQR
jgi:hypothetical protein